LAPGAQVCERHLVVVGSDYWYVWQPLWLCYFFVTFVLLVASTLRLKYKGHVHPVLSLLPADIAGGYTVCAAVTVSTFLFDYVLGRGRWYALAEPIFWICVLILAGTAVFQVSYLNKALAHFSAGVVVPTHFVLFTFFSILGPSILYHELSMSATFMLPAALMLLLFLLGIGLTFGGVFVLGSGKASPVEPNAHLNSLTDLSSGLAANDSAAAAVDRDPSVRSSISSCASSISHAPPKDPMVGRFLNLHPNAFNSISLPPPPPPLPTGGSEHSNAGSIASSNATDAVGRSPTM